MIIHNKNQRLRALMLVNKTKTLKILFFFLEKPDHNPNGIIVKQLQQLTKTYKFDVS